jgi:ATP-dependent Clp protease adaptor protein ClpS
MSSYTYTDRHDAPTSSVSIMENVYNIQPSMGDSPFKEQLLVLEPRLKVKRPPFYKVVMLNDDFTPMDFVVEMLTSVFRHTHEDAVNLMLQVHQQGSAVVGIYTRDIAETKVEIVINMAKTNEYPLQCVMEKE